MAMRCDAVTLVLVAEHKMIGELLISCDTEVHAEIKYKKPRSCVAFFHPKLPCAIMSSTP
eukprot:3008602-Rhodomonas_salina.1